MRSTSLRQRLLLLLALALPFSLVILFCWYQLVQQLDQAKDTAARSVIALEQHAANVLDVHTLVLRQLDDLTRGKSGSQIGNDARLREEVTNLTKDFLQISVVGMADADGRVWLNSVRKATNGFSVADRDYFLAHKNGAAKGLYISEAFTGRINGARQVGMSLRRNTPSGEFDGIIYTTIPLAHFTKFWKDFAPTDGYLIPLIRTDGTLIVRYPSLGSSARLSPEGPFMKHVRQSPRGLFTAASQIDGVERINAYSQIKSYPLYIAYSVGTALVLRDWWRESAMALAIAICLALTLGALWLAVVRQSHEQRVTATRWRRIAGDLEREVARRQQAEEAMRQSQKMEVVGQLAGGIAHDFNNLLAAILSNLQLMHMRIGQNRTEGLLRYVQAAESIVGKASSMTQRLLAFSRRQTLAPSALDVKDRISSMQELIARTVGPAIGVHTQFEPESSITVCDPNQLDSTLLNLAINARDAMPAGGELTIAVARTSLDAAHAPAAGLAPGDYIAISVQDTGTGMSEMVVKRVFEPFFTTKPIGQGTGLGLSMVYGFVMQSGGQVTINSVPGTGTKVTIYLPMHTGALPVAPAAPTPASPQRPAEQACILLVDDQDTVREPLAELLTELGYEVVQAIDGAEGLEVLKSSQPIDLLVSDVGLPGHMNGRQLADAGRVLRPNLRVMFITGYAEKSASEGGLLATGMEVMIKPFGLDDFAFKVATMIGKEGVVQGSAG